MTLALHLHDGNNADVHITKVLKEVLKNDHIYWQNSLNNIWYFRDYDMDVHLYIVDIISTDVNVVVINDVVILRQEDVRFPNIVIIMDGVLKKKDENIDKKELIIFEIILMLVHRGHLNRHI